MAKILVVDDQPINIDLLVTLLGYQGHQLIGADSGAEALERIAAERPDLVIADILMPAMDGYEFVRRLRTDPTLAHIPIMW
jgi:CheY-like chemotaxis protein